MEQTSLFEELLFWIPEVDTGCRMWKCPKCGGRMVGNSMNWESRNFNPYHFCPYCGQKLHTRTEGER
jgi:predicted RNA-binding Zn-ribbon protein involved in translation (DUF1610 family)